MFEPGDATEVVARQVHQHDVFRRFLRVGQQFLFVLCVLGAHPSARQRAGDRS